jgi:hypothetical protein
MPPRVLTQHQLTDEEADAALTKLAPVPDSTLVVVRNLQAQVSDLADRVATLEEA